MWEEIQDALEVEIPAYLRNILTISGYDNHLSLREITNDDINELQEFARRSVADIVLPNDMESYFGLYKNKPQNFTIVPGHRKLIVAIANYLSSVVRPAAIPVQPSKHLRVEAPPSRADMGAEEMQDLVHVIHPEEIIPDINPVQAIGRDMQVHFGDTTQDSMVLRANLSKWLTANRQFMKERMTANDLEVITLPDSSLPGRTYNLSVGIVKCKKCKSRVKLAMTCPGRHWVTSNFHRHVRRAHFKVIPNLPVSPSKKKHQFSPDVTAVASSTCVLMSEIPPTIPELMMIPDTPCFDSMVKVEMPSTSEDKGSGLEDHANNLTSYY